MFVHLSHFTWLIVILYLVYKISQKVFELGLRYLVEFFGPKSKLLDLVLKKKKSKKKKKKKKSDKFDIL